MSRKKPQRSHRDNVDWFRHDDNRALRIFLTVCMFAVAIIAALQVAHALGVRL